MKRLAAVALSIAIAALPACAQRGGSHGGFAGHAGSAFHGGFGGSAPSHFASPSGFNRGFSSRGFSSGGSFRGTQSFPRSGFGNSGARAPYYPNSGYRRPYRSRYTPGYRYAVPGGLVSWVNPAFPIYPGYYDDFDTSADTTQAYDTQPEEPFQPAPPDTDQPDTRESYQSSYPPFYAQRSYGQPSPPPSAEDAITIVFNDGRPSEQIHNYALTRSTLFVLDQHHQDIPVEEIDLAATEKANRDAGVNFQLPIAQQ